MLPRTGFIMRYPGKGVTHFVWVKPQIQITDPVDVGFAKCFYEFTDFSISFSNISNASKINADKKKWQSQINKKLDTSNLVYKTLKAMKNF